MLTIEAIWLDFVEKAAAGNPVATNYLSSELEAEYSTAEARTKLASIKGMLKDYDLISIDKSSATLAAAMTSAGKYYLHYVIIENRPDGWRITSFQ